MQNHGTHPRQKRAFTILEVMAVIIIIAILASMLLPFYSSFAARSEEARCLANLKNLYIAASAHLQAAGSWPQIPVRQIAENPKIYARSWVTVLAPYGAPHPVWICPTIQRTLGFPMDAIDQDEHYRIDFIATPFDENASTPTREPNHPWFIEKSGVHSRGNLLILANGSTMSLKDFMAAKPLD